MKTNLTKEQIKQNVAAYAAWLNGEPVQNFFGSQWIDWTISIPPTFLDGQRLYRPKPEPVQRPWSSREDFPKLETPIWLKQNTFEGEWMVIGVNSGGVWTHQGFYSWEVLESFQWATFKTDFKPCTVEEAP